jgi:PTS system mannose-specific IIC component
MNTLVLWDILVASVFFLPALAGRSACVAGFVERPVAIGLAWWAVTGEYAPALPLAVFFELFWLDLIPIGSYIQPMPSFPYLVVLALCAFFHWTDPTSLVCPILLSLPLAYLPPLVERRLRDYRKLAYNQLLHHSRKNAPLGALPARLVGMSILRQMAIGLASFLAAALLFFLVFSLPVLQGLTDRVPEVNWFELYAVASIGAVLSLRIRRAYVVFVLCMTTVAGMSLV